MIDAAWSRRRLLAAVAGGAAGAGCSGPSGGWTAAGGGGLAVEAPPTSRRDEPIAVRVTGAEPGAEVTLAASMHDAEGVGWTSEATFVADGRGVVDPGRRAPVAGPYDGVDAMGWLWSMTPTEGDWGFRWNHDGGTHDVELEASTRRGATARTIERRVYDRGTSRSRVGSAESAESAGPAGSTGPAEPVGWLYEPPGEGPHPGVVLLHGSNGVPLRSRAMLLASRGYAALALSYFGRGSLPDTLSRVPLSYFERAAAWLRARDGVADAPLGVVGTSRGGELALLLGARYGWVGAVVSYVGSGVVWPSASGEPAWTVDGDPVPALGWDTAGVPAIDGRHTRFRPVVEAALDRAGDDRLRAATIPVERTQGPILLLSGTADRVWPSRRLSAIAARRLRERGFAHPFAHLVYGEAGHYVSAPYRPTTRVTRGRRYLGGGTAPGYARAEADSWPRVLAYLEAGLG